MSRRGIGRVLATLLLACAGPAFAQSSDGATGEPPETIDLKAGSPAQAESDAACRFRRDAAIISGEIVVCGGKEGEGAPVLGSKEDRQRRYAQKTMNKGTLPPPDVAGAGIFRGPATVGGLCVKGIFNCPKKPALIVDVTALPQAPPGSDADRISRGLAPLGSDNRAPQGEAVTPRQREELALPDPQAAQTAAGASPAGSVKPAAPQ